MERKGAARAGHIRRWLLGTMLCAAVTLGGCVPVQNRELVLPRAYSSIDVPGDVRSAPEHATSPDGKYTLASVTDKAGVHLVLFQMSSEEPATIEVESVGREWLDQAAFSYRTIGWITGTQYLFAKVGWQPGGMKKDQRCVVLAVGDTTKKPSEEVASVDLPRGGVQIHYVPNRSKALLSLKTSVWEFDTVRKTLRLVKDGLPDHPYLSPIPSPSGDYYVYAREEVGREGLYILDTATGEERVLSARGQTLSFYPSWSFDGQYVAAYTAERKPGSTGTTWRDYDIIEGEDMAQTVGQGITVFDTGGNTVSSIRVEGKRLASFVWADSSHSIAFLTGTREASETVPSLPAISYDGLWVAKAGTGEAVTVAKKLTTIPKSESGASLWACPVAFDAAGDGVYYDVYESGIWYAREGEKPLQVVPGAWMSGGSRPVFWGAVLAIIHEAGAKTGLYLMAGREAVKFAEYPRASVLASSPGRLVIFAGEPVPPYPGKGRVVAYAVTRQ